MRRGRNSVRGQRAGRRFPGAPGGCACLRVGCSRSRGGGGWKLGSNLVVCQWCHARYDAMVELTLCPSHPLLPESSKSVRSHLIRDDVHIMNCFLSTTICAQCRVDVLSKHVSMHLQLADDIRAPPTIAATEETEAEHAAATRVCDGIDLVELDSDHAGKERLVCVVDDAAALHDIRLLFQKTLGRPADVVRVRTVIGVEDAGEVCWLGVVDVGEEVVEIVGFRSRVRDFDDGELVVLFRQLVKLRLNGLDWLWCVVNKSCAVSLA